MTTFMQRSFTYFFAIKAARAAAKEIKGEIEKAGLDKLKILAEAGKSIVGTYLQGCPPQEKKRRRQELSALVQMGITPDMVLTEVARQMPELAPIMESKQDYKKLELQNLERFLLTGD